MEVEDRLIRDKECVQLTGLSRTTLYRQSLTGEFPAKVQIGKRSSGRWYSEVKEWMVQHGMPPPEKERAGIELQLDPSAKSHQERSISESNQGEPPS